MEKFTDVLDTLVVSLFLIATICMITIFVVVGVNYFSHPNFNIYIIGGGALFGGLISLALGLIVLCHSNSLKSEE